MPGRMLIGEEALHRRSRGRRGTGGARGGPTEVRVLSGGAADDRERRCIRLHR